MKFLKTFELFNTPGTTGQYLDYDVGDIVTVINDVFSQFDVNLLLLKQGYKYEVLKIYKLAEDIYLKNLFMRVDVKDIKTGEIKKGWRSTNFKAEVEFDADKYNL